MATGHKKYKNLIVASILLMSANWIQSSRITFSISTIVDANLCSTLLFTVRFSFTDKKMPD
jgi:hypothetical protein